MITVQQILRKGDGVLLGIGLENAVLDVLTSDGQLEECLQMLQKPHRGLISATLGTFGVYPITLNLHNDESTSIFIDGPEFDQCRTQSAAIWLRKEELEQLLIEALKVTPSL
jgi:hypothetical protein